MNDVNILMKLAIQLIVWIPPCVLTAIVGAKKNRGLFGFILATIGVSLWFLWPLLGGVFGWLTFIMICSFKKNENGK